MLSIKFRYVLAWQYYIAMMIYLHTYVSSKDLGDDIKYSIGYTCKSYYKYSL